MGLLDPPGFRRNRHGQIWLHLPDQERQVLGGLLAQMAELLGEAHTVRGEDDPLARMVGIDDAAVRPADPVLGRLFPDAYDDPEEADDFRRFTARDLRAIKLAHLGVAGRTLARPDPTQLDAEESAAWLGALNDLRLTLGTRLALTDDNDQDDDDLDPDDPRDANLLIYHWLTYHQDHLVHALDKDLPR